MVGTGTSAAGGPEALVRQVVRRMGRPVSE